MNGPTVDYKTYTDAQLAEVRLAINPEKHPANFAALVAEIELRKTEGRWNPAASAAETAPLPPIPEEARELRFEYLGTGREYFPIWVTNFFLSLVTLGLFTPWAKVRARRYFYSRTQVAGATFSYRARPGQILAGRLLLFLLVAAAFANSVLGFLGWNGFFVALGMFAIVAPWILWKSARFNFANTSYRGICFSNDAQAGHFYAFAFTRLLFAVLSFGISTAFLGYQYRIFLVKHLRYGETPFKYVGSFRGFAGKLFPVMLGFFFTAIVVNIGFAMTGLLSGDAWSARAFEWIALLAFWGVADAVATSYISDNLELGGIRFRARFDKGELGQLYAVAAIKTAFTLGFAWPWARTEILRYKAERLTLHALADAENGFRWDPRARRENGGFATEIFEFDLGI